MNTMNESVQLEITNTNPEAQNLRKTTRPRDRVLACLIAAVALAMVIQVFRTVALQVEVNQSLDRLYHEAGQPLPAKS
jgi:hypothetical protein